MGLSEYKKKRHFKKTPEPEGGAPAEMGWSYVVQKHDASRLHYDFRLELGGVLKSWAVPKGPSLDPSIKRLAVQVEDHPVDYRDFEGIIPKGEYGGGTVLLWDTGHWEPEGDAAEGLRNGKLKFQLFGEKLKGRWTLVRSHSADGAEESRQWLLIKGRDEHAKAAASIDILESKPQSVASGRDLDEIAADKDRTWSSHKGASQTAKTRSHSKERDQKSGPRGSDQRLRSRTSKAASDVRPLGAKTAIPAKIDVQLATLTEGAPSGDEWLHEIKFDGYRMVCRIDGQRISFLSRNHQDWTQKLTTLVSDVSRLPVKQAILDGEVVVVGPDGTTDFQSLQNAFRENRLQSLKYYVFDLLYLNGRKLVDLPLEERKAALKALLEDPAVPESIRYSDHIRGGGDEFKRHACRMHLEGMISKRADLPYRPGRSFDWLKTKCLHKDEFVIGGYTDPAGTRSGIGALLVGFHDAQGELHYAGKVGTGFNQQDLAELATRLGRLEQAKSPFVDMKVKSGNTRTAHWVRPSLVGQFNYGSRTREGRLRHASFQGLREDKLATEVTLDEPAPLKTAVAASVAASVATSVATSVGASGAGRKRPAHDKTPDDLSRDHAGYDARTQQLAGVRLTHPEKVVYPDNGISKLDLAMYYRSVSGWLLPHLQHRPLVIVRCPEGQAKECFFQKHPGMGTPTNLRRIPIEEKKRRENYLIVDDVEGLISLAQVGALELHAWGSREDKLESPDRLIFDLDPAEGVPWKTVVDSALQIRDFLEQLGLTSFVKTTGGKGLHLVIPILRRHDWDEVKDFCKQVAVMVERAAPRQFTSNMSKAARAGRIFIDYLRNGRGATAIVPYSPRSRPGAPVSTPLTWEELSPRIPSNHFTIRNILERLSSLEKDPWEDLTTLHQSLSRPIQKLEALKSR